MKFLYLCLFGTALAGGVAQAEGVAGWVAGEGMSDAGKALTALPRAAVNIGHGVGSAAVDGATALGSGAIDGVKSLGSGAAGLYNSTTEGLMKVTADGSYLAPGGLSSLGSDIATWTSDGASWLGDSLASGYKATSDFMVSATDNLAGLPGRVGSSLWDSAKSAWNGATESIGGWFSGGSEVAGAATSFTYNPVTGDLTNWGTGITTNFNSGDVFGGASSLGGGASSLGGTTTTIDGVTVNWETGAVTDWNAPITDADAYTGLSDSSIYSDNFKPQDVYDKAAKQVLAEDKAAEAEAEAAAAVSPDKATVFNVIQYAIVILQALEGTEQEDITKEVNVKAQELQDSQGSSTPSTITETAAATPDVSMEATTLSAAANAMIALLQNNPIYPALLSEESCLLSGTSAASGTASGDSTEDPRSTNNYIQCMQKKRLTFANTTALSAQVIAEGSNAISHEFYDRISALATAAKSTTGTLGSMSVVNDSERFPYFEMVRGSALSAIQLELKAAETLSELTGTMEEVKDAQ